MGVDFEAVKKLPADEQVTEFKKVITTLSKKISEAKAAIAALEKQEKNEERDKKIAETKKTLDETTRDRNSAEQLLARSEIEAKALETVLTERTEARKEEEEKQALTQRQELENIVAQERTRDLERKQGEKRPEDAYKPRQGYEKESVYDTQNKFYETNGPQKPKPESDQYKSKDQLQREQEVIRAMYTGSDDGKGYR